MSHLVRLEGQHTVQTRHCALVAGPESFPVQRVYLRYLKFPRSEYHVVASQHATHQKDCTTFDTIALFSLCWHLCKGHSLPLLCFCTIFDSCKIFTDTDQTKIQSSSSGSREPGTTHILTGGRTQFPALYCCTAISQTRVLLRSCKLLAFSKSIA